MTHPSHPETLRPLPGASTSPQATRWDFSAPPTLRPGVEMGLRQKQTLQTAGPYGVAACVCLVAQLCPTLGDPMDCSPLGSSVHGLFQAKILECTAISSSRD